MIAAVLAARTTARGCRRHHLPPASVKLRLPKKVASPDRSAYPVGCALAAETRSSRRPTGERPSRLSENSLGSRAPKGG